MRISVSMITMNEEKNIGRALSSCGFADEIVIVDGGSTDRTLEILKSFDKVVLIQHPWENHFGRQRQVSLEHCTGDWVVRLDADEAFSMELEGNIRNLLSSTSADTAGYKIRQCNLVGNENYYSRIFDDYEAIPRIWRKRSVIRWERHIHEVLTGIEGAVVLWNVYVVHYGFLDRKRYWQKGQYYSQIPGSGFQKPERLYYREYDIQPRPLRSAVAPQVPEYRNDEAPEGLPRLAIIPGPKLNQWVLQNYETLSEKFNITVYSNDNPGFEFTRTDLPVIKLPTDPGGPAFLKGLEFELFDKDIVCTEEMTSVFTCQAVQAKLKFGKKVVTLVSENIFLKHEVNDEVQEMRQFNRNFVDVFAAGTVHVKEALLSEGVPEDKIVVVLPGPDTCSEKEAMRLASLFEEIFQTTYKGAVRGLAACTSCDKENAILTSEIDSAEREGRSAMKSYYEKNLDILTSINSSLASRVERITAGTDIEVLNSKEGLPTLKIKGIALHSTYYPGRESERAAEASDISAFDSIIVLGLGFGYHISPLFLKNYHRRIIIIEHRLDILKMAMEVKDLKALLESSRLLAGLDFEGIISDSDVINCLKGNPLIIENKPSAAMYKDYYGKIKNYIKQDRQSRGALGKLKVLMASLSSPVSSPFYYEKALRKICDVVSFGPSRDRVFWTDFAESLKSHYFYREGRAAHWIDLCTRLSKPCDIVTQRGVVDIRDILRQLPPGFKPDLFLWIDQHGENIPDCLEYLDCPKVALFGDTHLGDIKWRLQYALNFDYVFVMFNKQHIVQFKENGCQNVFWSPAACDPEIHCKIPSDKLYPVSFVGSTHPYLHHDRVRLLNLLRNNNIDIYIDSAILQDMSLIFSRSAMVLNKNIAEDLNQRVFEVLGTGSLLLTNRLNKESGMEDLFKDRQHLVIYDNEKELIELMHYYLKNGYEREKIASAGYREVLNKHTYDKRVEEIIRIVQEALSYSRERITSSDVNALT